MSKTRFILLLSGILACSSGVSTTTGKVWPPWQPQSRPEPLWLATHQHFVNNTLANGNSINVLLFGDSITEGWSTDGKPAFDKIFAPIHTANYGIWGDRTENVLWRIENGEVTKLSPKLCVLMVGTNNIDIGGNMDVDIYYGILSIIYELRQRVPQMKILLVGLLPRNNEEMTHITSKINSMLKQLDNGESLRFLDLKDLFYRGGNDFVAELYKPDLLHLTAAGYEKWGEVMRPIIYKMLV